MRDVLAALAAWRAEGVEAGRAVVIRTYGSAPRPEGAVLLVSDDGRLAGSVSGGCVEGDAAQAVARARASGHSRVIRYGISDEQAWDVGLACGGTIDVLVEPRIARAVEEAARGAERGSGGVAVVTPLPPGASSPTEASTASGPSAPPPEPLVIDGRGIVVAGTTGVPGTDAALADVAISALAEGRSRTAEIEGRAYLLETFAPRPRLVIVGAVEVARTLVRLAAELGFETVVVDGRPAFATEERFPAVDRLVVAWPDEAFATLDVGPSDAVAILSHDPKFDEPAIVDALRRGCRYVGAVGSRKTQADRRARLAEAGLSDAELQRLRGPIGLDLGGREPAEIALSVLAEIVASRHAASGMPMRDRRAAP